MVLRSAAARPPATRNAVPARTESPGHSVSPFSSTDLKTGAEWQAIRSPHASAVSGLPPSVFYPMGARVSDLIGRSVDLIDLNINTPSPATCARRMNSSAWDKFRKQQPTEREQLQLWCLEFADFWPNAAPPPRLKLNLSSLAAWLHSFYTGVENVLSARRWSRTADRCAMISGIVNFCSG